MIILPEHLLQVIYKVLYTTEVLSSFYHLYVVGGKRDLSMPFPGGDAYPDPDGIQFGIFHVHIGMFGYGVFEYAGSQHYPLIYHSKNSIKIIYVNSFN